MKNDRANDMNGHSYVTYRFMNEIVVTNESMWCLHYMYSLCYFVSIALVLDSICRNRHCIYLMPCHGYYSGPI